MISLTTLLQYCVLGVFLIVVVYGCARAAAFAYFRSKSEFLSRLSRKQEE